MNLLQLRNVGLSFGGPAIFEDINLVIENNERLCLIGRNGTGKTTLFKVLTGEIIPEEGEITRDAALKIARLEQSADFTTDQSIYEFAAGGLGDIGHIVAEYHALGLQLAHSCDEKLLHRMETLQHDIETHHAWHCQTDIETTLSLMELDGELIVTSLSGGMKRRAALARALVQKPDLLLLDEPTNHLDIEAIQWLEKFLLSYRGTVLFITHDRRFLKALATRIIELDRGRLTSWPGNYDTYVKRKQEALDSEQTSNALFDKKLAQEEVWIRQGIKARRTRNEGRVRALEKMRSERQARRQTMGSAAFNTNSSENSGKIVIEAKDINVSYDADVIISGFSTTVLRGDKIGIIGPNGCGKTTLINTLLGNLQPDSGTVRLGTRLDIAYFDQHRAQLDNSISVMDNVCEGSEQITVNGQSRHVMSYLADFLFAPDRARAPIRALSGGERNRLLLARLFAKPSNLLILDEPTNDLDAETLDLLEERLIDYTGTVLLISHDRQFLDNVVASTLVFEGHSQVNEYVGGYSDWQNQRATQTSKTEKQTPKPKNEVQQSKARKLSYKEAQELKALPKQIEDLEAEQEQLTEAMGSANFYQEEKELIAKATERNATIETELATAYARWEELEP